MESDDRTQSGLPSMTITNTDKTNTGQDESDLPFSYFCPQQEHIIWICDYDQERKITSVFFNTKEKEGNNKMVAYCRDLNHAKELRGELVGQGWRKMTAPKITVTLPEGCMSRQMKRQLQRQEEKRQRKLNQE